MKAVNKKYLIIILNFCFVLFIKAQEEEITIDYEETTDSSYVFTPKKLKPFGIKMTDELWNIKAGLNFNMENYTSMIPFTINYLRNFMPAMYVGLERRIGNFTVGLNSILFFFPSQEYYYEGEMEKSSQFTINLQPELRYYHNLKKRVSRGKSGKNFAANYFFIGYNIKLYDKIKSMFNDIPDHYSTYNADWNFTQGYWEIIETKSYFIQSKAFSYYNYLKLGYGIQRVFNNNLFFDAQTGVNVRGSYNDWQKYIIDLHISLKIGYSF